MDNLKRFETIRKETEEVYDIIKIEEIHRMMNDIVTKKLILPKWPNIWDETKQQHRYDIVPTQSLLMTHMSDIHLPNYEYGYPGPVKEKKELIRRGVPFDKIDWNCVDVKLFIKNFNK